MPRQMTATRMSKKISTAKCQLSYRNASRNITIIIKDVDGKIGIDNRDYKEITGQHTLGEVSYSGERFTDQCILSRVVVRGSVVQHKKKYKRQLGYRLTCQQRTRWIT